MKPSLAYSDPNFSDRSASTYPSSVARSIQNFVSAHSPIEIIRWRLNSAAEFRLAQPSTMLAATDRLQLRIWRPSSNCSCLGNHLVTLDTSSANWCACLYTSRSEHVRTTPARSAISFSSLTSLTSSISSTSLPALRSYPLHPSCLCRS